MSLHNHKILEFETQGCPYLKLEQLISTEESKNSVPGSLLFNYNVVSPGIMESWVLINSNRYLMEI